MKRQILPHKKLLAQWVKPVRRRLQLSWLLAFAAAVLFVAQSYALAQLFGAWLQQGFARQPLDMNLLAHWLPVLLGCWLLRPLLNLLRDNVAFGAALSVKRQVRHSLLNGLAHLGGGRHRYGSDGELSSRLTDQIDTLEGFVSRYSVRKLTAVTTPLLLLIAAATQSLLVAGIFVVTFPLLVVFMIVIGHLTARQSAAQLGALAQLSGRFLDWVRGMPTLQRLQADTLAADDIGRSAEQYRRRTMKVLHIAFLNNAVLELMASVSIALVAVYLGFGLLGILPWAKNTIPVDFTAALFLLLLAPEFYAPMRQLGADYHAKAQAEGAAEQLLPLWNAIAEAQARPSEKTTFLQIDSHTPPAISMSNICIRGEQGRMRVSSFSADIAAATRVALAGQSGSGKSSLLQMLLGFAAYEGRLKIDDTDFVALDKTAWQQQVGYLAQSAAFLPATIAENLRLAKADASDAELTEVLQAVELWPLVSRLPQGLDTPLGEHGRGLSGGQLQRLAVAQLLLRPAGLWLLDEPAEHLDPDTAARLNALLESLSRGKTVIWVSHHADELPWLDKVIVMPSATQGAHYAV
ncbi:ATP-binding cassette subfamily C protein CydD [Neisseria perflava]|uniref:thiol reductant ABC exporter subunit CydD n=1 Tax=Neisseria perflava TaxID=33053 RepID=UPI00209D4918|nr:thiol reductant ABC exporter subunit CydD [Neisseria perflava]MCP1772499.1 ATP-binding cassette subfamily C protein CydD [Neisseria perflava]